MVTDSLTGKMGVRPILPVRLSVTIATMLNFDGHCDGDGDGVGMCKQAFRVRLNQAIASMKSNENNGVAPTRVGTAFSCGPIVFNESSINVNTWCKRVLIVLV